VRVKYDMFRMRKNWTQKIQEAVEVEKNSADYARDYYDSENGYVGLFALDTKIVTEMMILGNMFDATMGRGRHLLHFAGLGREVVGNDYNIHMLELAKQDLAKAGFQAPLYNLDVADLSAIPDASFDNILCLFSSLGCVPAIVKRERVLGEFSRILRPGGRVFVHVHNRWQLTDGWRNFRIAFQLSWFQRKGLEPGDNLYEHDGLGGVTYNHYFTPSEFRSLFLKNKLVIVKEFYLNANQDDVISGWFKGWRAGGFIFVGQKK